jgi:hypothetical protein
MISKQLWAATKHNDGLTGSQPIAFCGNSAFASVP